MVLMKQGRTLSNKRLLEGLRPIKEYMNKWKSSFARCRFMWSRRKEMDPITRMDRNGMLQHVEQTFFIRKGRSLWCRSIEVLQHLGTACFLSLSRRSGFPTLFPSHQDIWTWLLWQAANVKITSPSEQLRGYNWVVE